MAQNVIINGVTYPSVPSVTIPKSGGGSAVFYDTSGANAAAGDILTGKSAYGSSGALSGSMANNGDVSGTISTKAGTVMIPAGYTTGGITTIAGTEKDKIISGNIRAGVTILGVSGSASVVDTSDADATASYIYTGKTAYVNGAKITGEMTAVVISQDSTTKVLTIS